MKITNANGVTGCLLNPYHSEGRWVFRVYHSTGEFTDYLLQHSDLCVTITDEDAGFYINETTGVNSLDHSPETLGIKNDS